MDDRQDDPTETCKGTGTSMNTENDYYTEAVRSYQQANKNLKHFAECCAHLADDRLPSLAVDCGVSQKTVNNYRDAYLLYVELGRNVEAVSKLWQTGNISLWVKAAQLQTQLNLPSDKIEEYLGIAVDNSMTRESFAAHVDEAENHTPKWIRRLQQAIRFLKPTRSDYKADMPPILQERYDAAVAAFVAELEAIAEAKEVA